MLEQIKAAIANASLVLILDVAIVLFIFYRLYLAIRGTRAVQLLKGLAVLVIFSLISQWAGLNITGWLLNQTLTVGLVALPIIFYPELRRALEHIGRGSLFSKSSFLAPVERTHAIDELMRAVLNMAERRVGALIVWEQETGLKDWSESGVKVDAVLTAELLINIFAQYSLARRRRNPSGRPDKGRLLLPSSRKIPNSRSTGHQAPGGTGHIRTIRCNINNVSEETGAISLAHQGKLIRYLDEKGLGEWLQKNVHNRQLDHIFRRNHSIGKDDTH